MSDFKQDIKASPTSATSTLTDLKQYAQDFDQKPADDKAKMEEELQRKVDETIQRIRDTSEQLQAVAMPYAQITRDFAEEKPVLFTFLVIFAALSAIPVLCFATFLIASTIFIVGIAAIGVCLSVLGTIFFGAAILLPVLLFTLISSTFILAFLLSLFLAHRLYLHLTVAAKADPDKANLEYLTVGVKSWADETKARVDLSALGVNKVRWADFAGSAKGGQWVLGGDAKKDEVEVKVEDGEVVGLRLRGVGQGPGLST